MIFLPPPLSLFPSPSLPSFHLFSQPLSILSGTKVHHGQLHWPLALKNMYVW